MASYVMEARGLHIGRLPVRDVDREQLEAADLIILLRDPDEDLGLPTFPEKTIEWHIQDPFGWSVDVYEEVRDEIRREIEVLRAWFLERLPEDTAAEEDGLAWAAHAPVRLRYRGRETPERSRRRRLAYARTNAM